MSEQQAGNVKVSSKLTLRGIVGKITLERLNQIKAATDDGSGGIHLADIIGIASDYKAGATDKGEFVRFLGDFEGISALDGSVHRSGCCILPGAAENLIYGALRQLGGDAARAVRFGFRFRAVYDDSAATKYVFSVESLQAPGANDPLAGLRSEMSAGGYRLPGMASVTQLPAPVASAPEAPPAPAAAPAPVAEAPKAAAGGKRK